MISVSKQRELQIMYVIVPTYHRDLPESLCSIDMWPKPLSSTGSIIVRQAADECLPTVQNVDNITE